MVTNTTQLDNDTLDMLQNKVIQSTLPAVYFSVAIISIPGHIFSLCVFFRHIKPKTPSVIFMINLSITDLTLAFCLPFQISYHWKNNNWIFGKSICSLVTVMFYTNMYTSILTMTCISIERYLGVVYPMKLVQWRRKRYALAACLGMWAFLLLALYPLASSDLTYEVKALGIITCFDVLKWDMLPNIAAWAIFLLTLFVLLFLIPFIVTVVCYIATIRKLIQTSSKQGSRQKTRSIYLAAVVLLVFVTCFAPNNFILFVHMISRLFFEKSFYPAYKLTLGLSCLNNCLDPFVYYFVSKEFYQAIRCKAPYNDSLETRRESLFSGRTMSVRSMSSGPMEGLDGVKDCLQRQESVF
ncbi:P2Y purinoceptor 8 [Pelodiscus sinensis]|nr:P2Y purinoceptor 8 [Pelodiscus sinensis]XP_014435386.1 P2Y purinoceptor 8 [Pelodiscus sinensis]|eukprot:XP_006135912.1 P2Y purinoceptor 8 [Pelodiscus sinensis]